VTDTNGVLRYADGGCGRGAPVLTTGWMTTTRRRSVRSARFVGAAHGVALHVRAGRCPTRE
jgi:hypothetical protein